MSSKQERDAALLSWLTENDRRLYGDYATLRDAANRASRDLGRGVGEGEIAELSRSACVYFDGGTDDRPKSIYDPPNAKHWYSALVWLRTHSEEIDEERDTVASVTRMIRRATIASRFPLSATAELLVADGIRVSDLPGVASEKVGAE